MTEDELKRGIVAYSNMADYKNAQLLKIVDDFFESNVCIPKGENVIIQKQLNVDEWCDAGMFAKDSTYSIKPSEPIYEWQYEYKNHLFTITTDFMTDEELISKRETCKLPKHIYIKKVETKRIRK